MCGMSGRVERMLCTGTAGSRRWVEHTLDVDMRQASKSNFFWSLQQEMIIEAEPRVRNLMSLHPVVIRCGMVEHVPCDRRQEQRERKAAVDGESVERPPRVVIVNAGFFRCQACRRYIGGARRTHDLLEMGDVRKGTEVFRDLLYGRQCHLRMTPEEDHLRQRPVLCRIMRKMSYGDVDVGVFWAYATDIMVLERPKQAGHQTDAPEHDFCPEVFPEREKELEHDTKDRVRRNI